MAVYAVINPPAAGWICLLYPLFGLFAIRSAGKSHDRIFAWVSSLFGFFFLFAVYAAASLMNLQYFTDPSSKDKRERIENKIMNAKNTFRGDIVSSDMKTMALYYPEFVLLADFKMPFFAKKTIDENNTLPELRLDTMSINIYRRLAAVLAKIAGSKSSDEYFKQLRSFRLEAEKKNARSFTRPILKQNINILQREEIFELPCLKNYSRYKTGIYTEKVASRFHPFGNMAHSVVGSANSSQSFSGIEKLCDTELSSGLNVISTIDTKMQDICETLLRDKLKRENGRCTAGTVILMETATGDIKAMANAGDFRNISYNGNVRDIHNNALMAAIEPGSTFKIASLTAALETGKVSIYDSIDCDAGTVESRDKRTKRWKNISDKNKRFGKQTVAAIMEMSMNIGTAKMVDKAFGNNGRKFIEALRRTGAVDTIRDMNSAPAFLLSPSEKVWNANSMYYVSHGYQVRLTPLHVLAFYNSIANGGLRVKPRLVRGVKYNTGTEKLFEPEVADRPICSEKTLDAVRTVLSGVVIRGSASSISGARYGIAGKTGTAQMYPHYNRDAASFCGYFPAKSPRYSCIVVLYTRKLTPEEREKVYAAELAVPLFRDIADRIYVLNPENRRPFVPREFKPPRPKNISEQKLQVIVGELGLPPFQTDADMFFRGAARGIMPDVRGMGLRDAVLLLERRGLKVRVSGVGHVVRQTPEQGARCEPRQTAVLELGG
jgi:cell division protein FtsI (penicillin-binding protein 3)